MGLSFRPHVYMFAGQIDARIAPTLMVDKSENAKKRSDNVFRFSKTVFFFCRFCMIRDRFRARNIRVLRFRTQP